MVEIESLIPNELKQLVGCKMIIIAEHKMIYATLIGITSKGNFIFDDNFEVYQDDIIERKVYIFKEEIKNG